MERDFKSSSESLNFYQNSSRYFQQLAPVPEEIQTQYVTTMLSTHQPLLEKLSLDPYTVQFVEKTVVDTGNVYLLLLSCITESSLKYTLQQAILSNYHILSMYLLDKDLEKATTLSQTVLSLQKVLSESYDATQQITSFQETQNRNFVKNYFMDSSSYLHYPQENFSTNLRPPKKRKKAGSEFSRLVIPSKNCEMELPKTKDDIFSKTIELLHEKIDHSRKIRYLIDSSKGIKNIEIFVTHFIQLYQGVDSLLASLEDNDLYCSFQVLILEDFCSITEKMLELKVPYLAYNILASLSSLGWRYNPLIIKPSLINLKQLVHVMNAEQNTMPEDLPQQVLHHNEDEQITSPNSPSGFINPEEEIAYEQEVNLLYVERNTSSEDLQQQVLHNEDEEVNLTPISPRSSISSESEIAHHQEMENRISAFLIERNRNVQRFLFNLNAPLDKKGIRKISTILFESYHKIDLERLLSFFNDSSYKNHAKHIIHNYYMIGDYLFKNGKIKAAQKTIGYMYQLKWRFDPIELEPDLAKLIDSINRINVLIK